MVSTKSASHFTVLLEPVAPSWICTRPRYEVRPPPRATDFETMLLEVLGAAWTILAPASWCWFSPANATDKVSPLAYSPSSQTAGYFMVTLEPRFPSTHSMVPPACTAARLVARL